MKHVNLAGMENKKLISHTISIPLDIFTLRQSYLDNTFSPMQVIEEVLQRIERFQDHNIWISVRAPEVLFADVTKLELRDPSSLPLFGIPFAVKDNIDVEGIPTTAACPEFCHVPDQTAFAVRRLTDAGAILIGKTNLDQFATGLTGTRVPQPYGICRNALNPDYISGGSSSGSAVAVALNIVSFTLGTDTAGSGRVPAAFNNIVGLKPSQGLISCMGVVPACKSLDCVSVFTRSIEEAELLFDIMNIADPDDAYARKDRKLLDASDVDACSGAGLRVGVPKPRQLEFFGNDESAALFADTVTHLKCAGAIVEEIDLGPFLEAASMLYGGPWVAERYAGIRSFIEAHPNALHPVTAEIYNEAQEMGAVAVFEALHRMAELKRLACLQMRGLACIAVPTAGTIYRIDEVLADPIRLNTNLGYYTNYMNLLDLSAVAVPAGFYANGLPFGITLFANALSDRRLLALARCYIHAKDHYEPYPAKALQTDRRADCIRIVVCGAHMRGLPLNRQLLDLDARFCAATRTADRYRLYALTQTPPPVRPGLQRDAADGAAIDVEIWEMPSANFPRFLGTVNSPLCIGSVELEDGGWEHGFLCETYGLADAADITRYGGWRNYLASG